ncbi:MAG TPA: hypothetical protein GXZ38_05800 [Spirochaetales bacterium]|nr:hypothetical protein [Spirochaetales bacterium]
MKNKVLIIFITLMVVSSSLFAAYNYPQLFYPNTTYKPISARVEAMGGAGLATASGGDALFINPANLSSKKFSLNLPSVTVTLFNPFKILESDLIEDLQDMEDFDMEDPAEMLAFANKVSNIFGFDKGEVLTTDLAVSFTAGGFGLGINVQEQLHTSNNVGDALSLKLIAEVNAALTLGYGYRFNIVPKVFSIDAGVSVRFAYKAYTNRVGISDAIGLFMNDDEDADILGSLMSGVQLAAGWALPIDVGVNFNLPVGFRVSAVARDINGKYTMQNYPEMGMWVNDLYEFIGLEPEYVATTSDESVELIHEVPWKLDLGVAWAPSFGKVDKFVKPTIAVDLVDTITMFEKVGDNPDAFWNYFRAGAEVRLLSVLDVRAGFNQGYFSVGVGLDLFAIKLDASYYWREFGKEIGDKPVDALTVRVNLGFDR